MSQPNDNLKSTAQMGENFCSEIITALSPEDTYREHMQLKNSINMHAGMAAAESLLFPVMFFNSEKA